MAYDSPAGRGNTFTIRRDLTASSVDEHVHIFGGKAKLLGIKEIHSVAGTDASAVTLQPRKITADATAPSAAAGATVIELTTAAINLKATANAVQTPTLSTTASDLLFDAGDKLSHNFTGTLTALVGMVEYRFLEL